MASPVVIALYRTLLRSTQTLQRDVEAGRTLYNAIRSGAVASYAGVKSDWQRERMFVRRFEDMEVLKRRGASNRTFAAIVRSGFGQPVDAKDQAALDARIDAAFDALKSVDDHNALIREFRDQGDFWTQGTQQRHRVFAAAGPRVVYDILPHSPGFSFASKLYNVPQEEIRLDESPKAVVHPALLLYFDGFDGTHHIASEALAARYPTDISGKPKAADVAVSAPSIIQLQSADEDKLLTYLRCDDSTIVQFVMASLEGMWLGECGQSAQNEVQRAVELAGQKKWDEAREMLEQVVHDFPEFAYAWNKLAMVEYQSGNFGRALGHYETAIKLKPQLVEALVGLGTCATRLQRWSLAHRAAVLLLEVQPSNDTARMLIEQAVYATL
ncbi:O-linked N-acetylglucosamine transferase OGT [Phytophthora cinnamomi]|uniref:O-linked N-acetylglucosamine transferase OGT n=1 Tax=Phytophthora cinnamomi TaxID=4785 RepID=UPI003559B294|nr:O-linked N-acetylglucosamine transferase OGT [Phytophthora cinnamomi]